MTTPLSTGDLAATREEHQPNSRYQFDNIFTFGKSGMGGEHLFKAGVQWGKLGYTSDYDVAGRPLRRGIERRAAADSPVQHAVVSDNIAYVTGLFFQDAWSMNRLTLNLGARYDKYVGKTPEQTTAGGQFIAAQTFPEKTVIDHSKGVWRAGASYDLTGSGRTALEGQLQPLRAAGRH